ncbi:hypothetical protein KY335_05555, partial [Candidatus Woesearchaeota archaeon]|nr:hypothetical protein [Candidatus Woesearchaeota archaeon]
NYKMKERRFKREYEFAIVVAIIVVCIGFTLYYSGFVDGGLPTGAAFVDSDGDGISDQIAIACAALACPLCGSPFAPGADTDGNGVPDNGCAAGSCQVAAGIPCPEVGGDNDGDFAPTLIESNAYASFLIALNPAATYVGCSLTGSTATTWDYTCFSSDGFSFDPISLAAVFSGSATCSALPTGPTTFQVSCPCPSGLTSPLAFSWTIPIGDSPPGLLDNRIGPPGVGYVVTSDDITTYDLDISGSGTCPATAEPEPDVIYTGGGAGCNPRLRSPQVIKVSQTDNLVEILVEIQHLGIFRGLPVWARVSYPLENQVKVEGIEFMGLVDSVPGVKTPTNAPGIYKVTLNINPDGTPYYGRTDIFIGFGNDPDKCYVASTIELVETMIQKPTVVCSKEMIQQNIQIDVSDVGVDNGFFSFKVNADFDPSSLPCDYIGEGIVQLISAQVLADGAYLMSSVEKEKGGTAPIGSGGIVRGGGIGGFAPDGGSAEPGVPPLPPAPGDGDKINMPFIIKVMVDGIIYSIPTTVSFPIPRITTTGVPTITTVIPDEEIPKFFVFDPIPGITPFPIPYPDPIPYPPKPNPPIPLPDPIQRIFNPQPRGGEFIHSINTQSGPADTTGGKILEKTRAIKFTNDRAQGSVYLGGPFGGVRGVVRLLVEHNGELVENAVRAVLPATDEVKDLTVLTEQVIPSGRYSVTEWSNNIGLDTRYNGNAFYELDYNNLEDGSYSLIALSGNKFKTFYFDKKGSEIIFLTVPGRDRLIASLKLVTREVGLPVTITSLGKEEVTVYYKDQKWNNEAGQQTIIPEDLT